MVLEDEEEVEEGLEVAIGATDEGWDEELTVEWVDSMIGALDEREEVEEGLEVRLGARGLDLGVRQTEEGVEAATAA